MPKIEKIHPLKISNADVQFKIYMVTGVIIPHATIKAIRLGNRSQDTTNGELIAKAEESIREFYEQEKWL